MTEFHTRNIELGITALHDAWVDPEIIFGSVISSADSYSEVFRTEGERKKVKRNVAEMRRAIIEAEKREAIADKSEKG